MSINPKVKISESEHLGKLKRSVLKENDILFSIAGSLGKVGLVDSTILPANTNQALAIIRLTENKDIEYSYIFSYLKSNYIQHFIRRLPSVGAQPNLSLKQINELVIKFPNYCEQQKISNMLDKLNNILTLYERKYQLYLLQFQKLQRVIFDNSDDFISLSYLIEIKTGNRNSQDNVKNGKYVFFDRSTEIKRLNEFDFDEEAIIIPGEGTKFAPKYINGKYALHQRSYSLYNFSQEIDSKYLYYFLMTQSNTLLRYSVGTTVPSLRVSTFDHIKVPMYSKELQIKYALTFDSLEKLMNQIKKKTNILRSLKRFLLQVLFL